MNVFRGLMGFGAVLLVLAFIGLVISGIAHGLYIESHPLVSYRWQVRVQDVDTGKTIFDKQVINRYKPHVSQEGDSVSVSWYIGQDIFDREEHTFPADAHVSVVRKGYYKRPGVVYREGHTLLPADES